MLTQNNHDQYYKASLNLDINSYLKEHNAFPKTLLLETCFKKTKF